MFPRRDARVRVKRANTHATSISAYCTDAACLEGLLKQGGIREIVTLMA